MRPTASGPSQLLVLAATIFALSTVPARAEEPSPEFQASVAELMRITGASSLTDQVATNLSMIVIDGLRKSMPELPDRAIEIMHEVTLDFYDELFSDEARLTRDYAAIYAKHFTKAELDEMIAFYHTPTGRKAIQAMPSIVQESLQMSQQWAVDAQPRLEAELTRRLSEEGFLPEAPKP
ncbi:MAG TPA: DUF2059 domain-containing protein [Myxococcota bacterium]|nr:DUF2059 domain-containing protein [Myxococcota bacterium]